MEGMRSVPRCDAFRHDTPFSGVIMECSTVRCGHLWRTSLHGGGMLRVDPVGGSRNLVKP